jgi:MIP family channel proteins
MKELRSCVAEVIGTFFLCFAGISAICCTAAPINSGAGLVGIAFAHGLALSVAINCFGGISGAHFNPAVTGAMLVTGRIKPALGFGYIISQCLGSAIAAVLCKSIFPAETVTAVNLGIPLPNAAFAWVTPNVVMIVEAVLTFLLVTAVFGTAVDERGKAVKIGAFGIGLTVTFDILAAGPITGASMNPARSFGPALIQGDFGLHWCYWVGPMAGGAVAALIYHHFLLRED